MTASSSPSIRDLLNAVYDQNGGVLTPANVVAAATPKKHPLHNRFEWDNGVAGHAWRCEQARQLIKSVNVVRVPARNPDDDVEPVRYWQTIRSTKTGEHVFEKAAVVVKSEKLTAQVLLQMEADWQALRLRYSKFKEFAVMVRRDVA